MKHGFFVKVTKKHCLLLVIPPAHGVWDIALETKVRVNSHPVDLELFGLGYLVQKSKRWFPKLPGPVVKVLTWANFEPELGGPNRDGSVSPGYLELNEPVGVCGHGTIVRLELM